MASRRRMRRLEWTSPRSRAAETAAAVSGTAKRAPASKDKKLWCGGHAGRSHVARIVFRPATVFDTGCRWAPRWTHDGSVAWKCLHALVCNACGKVLDTRVAVTECPAYPGSEAQRAAAEAEAAETRERISSWRARGRPVIDGPQGYRRRRTEP